MDSNDIRRARRILALKAFGVLLGVLVVEVLAFFVVVYLDISSKSLWATGIPEIAGAAAVVLGMLMLGGGSWIGVSRKDVSYTFRFGWWCILVGLVLCAIELASYVSDGTQLSSRWPIAVCELAVLCLAIGVFEEVVFRGILYNCLLAFWGSTHRGVVWATVVTSLLFGLAHVDFSVAGANLLAMAQAVLKVVQTGIYSFMLCVIALRTRKLGGVSLFHGYDDFIILLPSAGLFGKTIEVDYVSTGDDATWLVFYYLIIIALYMPMTIKAARELRRGHDVYQGVFTEDVVAAVERADAARAARAFELAAGAPVPLFALEGEPGAGSAPLPQGVPAVQQPLPTPFEAAPTSGGAFPVAASPAVPVAREPEQPVPAPYVPAVPVADAPQNPVAHPTGTRDRRDGRPPAPFGL